MRKIFLFMVTSTDGYFEGPGHDISWHNVDEEFNEFAENQLSEIGTLLFGRKTYDLMAGYWPTVSAEQDDPEIAKAMNSKQKYVISKTLKKAEWENTELIDTHHIAEIAKLKEQSGKNIAVFGSSDLCVSLIENGLLDEIRLLINPVILGDGKILLAGLHKKIKLRTKSSRAFQNGNVLISYEVIY